jgi:hypothetical protein
MRSVQRMNKKENEQSNTPRLKAPKNMINKINKERRRSMNPKLLKKVTLAQEQRKRVHKRVGNAVCHEIKVAAHKARRKLTSYAWQK